jgi:hypothetical protein
MKVMTDGLKLYAYHIEENVYDNATDWEYFEAITTFNAELTMVIYRNDGTTESAILRFPSMRCLRVKAQYQE